MSYARDFYDSRSRGLDFFDELGGAEFVFGEAINVRNWLTARRLNISLDHVP